MRRSYPSRRALPQLPVPGTSTARARCCTATRTTPTTTDARAKNRTVAWREAALGGVGARGTFQQPRMIIPVAKLGPKGDRRGELVPALGSRKRPLSLPLAPPFGSRPSPPRNRAAPPRHAQGPLREPRGPLSKPLGPLSKPPGPLWSPLPFERGGGVLKRRGVPTPLRKCESPLYGPLQVPFRSPWRSP